MLDAVIFHMRPQKPTFTGNFNKGFKVEHVTIKYGRLIA